MFNPKKIDVCCAFKVGYKIGNLVGHVQPLCCSFNTFNHKTNLMWDVFLFELQNWQSFMCFRTSLNFHDQAWRNTGNPIEYS
jgi:hypothetical protein